tara:strand:- start:191 stop:373 length:183 start_codon:yes stop_codon:yes gene_type:complete
MSNNTNRWVAIVYAQGDKIDSKGFRANSEEEAAAQASEWVKSRYGERADWSLHHVASDNA